MRTIRRRLIRPLQVVVWFLAYCLRPILRLHGFCHYCVHVHNVTSWSFIVMCSEDAPCFKYPTDLQFWTGEFLNVLCGDGLHFHSSFPVCLVLNMWIPCGVAIIEVKNVFLTYCILGKVSDQKPDYNLECPNTTI